VGAGAGGGPCTVRRLNVRGVRRSGSNLAAPLVHAGTTIDVLDVEDIYVIDDGTSGASKPQVEVASGQSVGRFSARKVRLFGSSGQQDMPVLKVDSGATVGLASLDDVKSDRVLSLIGNAGTMTTSLGSGLSMADAGSGGIVANSGTWTNSILSNTDQSTAGFTGTAPATKGGDYYRSGGSTPASISISPASLGTGLAGQTVAVTGSDFTTATTFTLSGLAGTSLTATTIHSRTSATLTVTTGSTAGSATIQCSDFSTATLVVAAGVTVYMEDDFAGTGGTTIAGRTPAPTQNGSDVWALGQDSTATLAVATGGSGETSSGAGTNWSAYYPLTGVSTDQVVTSTLTIARGTAAVVTWNLRADSPVQNALIIQLNLAGTVCAVNTYISGMFTLVHTDSVTPPTGTPFDVVMTLSGTTLGISIGGTSVLSGFTVPSATAPGIYIRQEGGSVGDVVFNKLKVTS
jgi:hypothetical protein